MPPRRIQGISELQSLVGQEAGVSDWLTVTQAAIDCFAETTGDQQWIHVDPERAARESPYGGTIAHGFLTLALISQLHHQAVEVAGFSRVINYGLNRVRFPSAVRAGARIRGRSTLQALNDFEGGVQLSWQITVEVEGQEKPALVAEWLLRLFR
ncbi:MAG: MaoC family dehydratase [Planctomycetia bacterium]|nr:MaoC family dehydratase [Planctomycetia bacterium]